jgi:DHA2 family multidrug resistance protein-like MFS transporter
MTLAVEAPRATRREWTGLAALTLPCVAVTMDVTVLHLAVPTLTADLRPSPSQLLWIIDIYGFLLAGLLITMGNLGDRIGRRRLLTMGAAAFAGASTMAALSTSAAMLIAARAILGVAGATLAPSTLSLIRNMFHDPAQRTTAIGVWGTSFAAGGAIGPLVGGLLLAHFGWSSVFWLPVPVMVLLVLVARWLLPEFRDPDAGRLDLGGAGLSISSVLAVIYGLKRLAQGGGGALAVGAMAVGLALGAGFVRRQRRSPDPLVDLHLFQVPAFSATIATLMLTIFTIFGLMFLEAQYFQLVLGLSPLDSGFWMLPSSVVIVISSLGSSRLARLAPRTTVLILCAFLVAVGFAVMACVQYGGLPVLVVGAVIWGVGAGPIGTLGTDLVVSAAPAERAGAAASLSETGAELGGSLGMALLGSLAVVIYRMGMAGVALPGVPPAASDAARETIGAAVAAAHRLPPAASATILTASRAAFARAFVVAAIVSSALMLGATALMAAVVRRER